MPLRATMAIAIIQTGPKGITCKITAIITAIKSPRKCQELSYKLTGVGIGQNTAAIKIRSTNKGIFFLSIVYLLILVMKF
ncbi:hypothetical protein F2I70_04365 [Campylobacter jejuni]|uniref:Uncharacterized protein n=1 Tax=Campylobacter jejuni TaxID=197 RepID=A0A5Y8SKQ4_CAMJU|nr:hypothetical protein [Campylobacter jejuni]EIB53980.1 hypothetical protein cje160_08376 [Campylobacter jejuni subsp. jejuni 2008-979]EAI0195292.1 hypothetical protein [Campylobacter jejuni]EAI6928375.1 hypothetical protein [Campylobacter jejuni]EAI7680525.1 hypothetical protein [Campylobacter jejuni]EAI9915485.1 hypothetical protein [Campylobacter jejuni]